MAAAFVLLLLPAFVHSQAGAFDINSHKTKVTVEEAADCLFRQEDVVHVTFNTAGSGMEFVTSYEVSDFVVTSEGTTMNGPASQVKRESETAFTWNFENVAAGNNATFTLAYAVAGQSSAYDTQLLTTDVDKNVLTWKAISEGWAVDVNNVEIAIFIKGVADSSAVTSVPDGFSSVEDGAVKTVISADRALAQQGLEVTCTFPKIQSCGALATWIYVVAVIAVMCCMCGMCIFVLYTLKRKDFGETGSSDKGSNFDQVALESSPSSMNSGVGNSSGGNMSSMNGSGSMNGGMQQAQMGSMNGGMQQAQMGSVGSMGMQNSMGMQQGSMNGSMGMGMQQNSMGMQQNSMGNNMGMQHNQMGSMNGGMGMQQNQMGSMNGGMGMNNMGMQQAQFNSMGGGMGNQQMMMSQQPMMAQPMMSQQGGNPNMMMSQQGGGMNPNMMSQMGAQPHLQSYGGSVAVATIQDTKAEDEELESVMKDLAM